MADNSEFLLEQQRAIERMLEMSRRSENTGVHNMPPMPPFVKLGNNEQNRRIPQNQKPQFKESETHIKNEEKRGRQNNNSQHEENRGFLGLDIPFLDKITSTSDLPLILGLALLLWSEKADKKLLLALLYILF